MKDVIDLLKWIEEGDETKILEEKDLQSKLNELWRQDLIVYSGDKLSLSDKGKSLKERILTDSLQQYNPNQKHRVVEYTNWVSASEKNPFFSKTTEDSDIRLTFLDKSMFTISLLALGLFTLMLTFGLN